MLKNFVRNEKSSLLGRYICHLFVAVVLGHRLQRLHPVVFGLACQDHDLLELLKSGLLLVLDDLETLDELLLELLELLGLLFKFVNQTLLFFRLLLQLLPCESGLVLLVRFDLLFAAHSHLTNRLALHFLLAELLLHGELFALDLLGQVLVDLLDLLSLVLVHVVFGLLNFLKTLLLLNKVLLGLSSFLQFFLLLIVKNLHSKIQSLEVTCWYA